MSRPTHSGPPHTPGCLGSVRVLGAPTGHGRCACRRADWLAEPVPRGQARGELLDQLAGWATEQRIAADSDIDVAGRTALGQPAERASAHISAGIRAAGRIAHDIWVDVRLGALGLAAECSPHRPQPVVTASAAPVPDASVMTVTTTGGRL